MSPDWMLTWTVVAFAGMIVVQMPAQSARPPDWQWDASHHCRLTLLDTEPATTAADPPTTRVRIRSDTVFAVRYRLRMLTGGVEAASLSLEAWPRAVSEIVLPVASGAAEVSVPDCRRRL